MKNGLIM